MIQIIYNIYVLLFVEVLSTKNSTLNRSFILILFCSENNISLKVIDLVFKKKASGIVFY